MPGEMGLIIIFFRGCCAAIRTRPGEANDLAGDEPTSVPASPFAFFTAFFPLFPLFPLFLSSSLPLFPLFPPSFFLIFSFIFYSSCYDNSRAEFFSQLVKQAKICTNLQAVCLTSWGKWRESKAERV